MSDDAQIVFNELMEKERTLIDKEYRIQELESALIAIRRMTGRVGFARHDLLWIIDKVLNEDSDDE